MPQKRGTSTARRNSAQRSAEASDPSPPKTTRPDASERRAPERARTSGDRIGRTLDAVPDRVDIRDWLYRPRLAPLPDELINCDFVPFILDQGQQGACTGFALAAVVNYLLHQRGIKRRVSPYMLYELARRYDEWPGENYEGSSARGGMKAWLRHGVCAEDYWPSVQGVDHLLSAVEYQKRQLTIAELARQTPGGAFYRINHREVRDVHAALAEVGIVYCTLMAHEGWQEPGPLRATIEYFVGGKKLKRKLPVITRKGTADGGHAVALVGYTRAGFIIQNSWSDVWGERGFAVLPYEDFMLHATDLWAAQLGVPVEVDLWTAGLADTSKGRQRASPAIPLSEIRPYVIDVGNNGCLSSTGDYFTTEGDIERLLTSFIPDKSKSWSKKRIMLYLHGGLNDEHSVARRVIAFRDVMLDNEIYPIHVMWESGAMESINDIVQDLVSPKNPEAAASAAWLDKLRDGLYEARDRTIELTTAKPGGALWSEMKENGALASARTDGSGAMQILAKHVANLLGRRTAATKQWEIHVVAHSAGSIFAAHLLPLLLKSGIPFRSFQLMAPAVRIDVFKKLMYPHIKAGRCPQPTLYVLSETGERDDKVGPYGKSLLYLVSNAFEDRRETPILGMLKFISQRAAAETNIADADIEALLEKTVNGLPSLVVAGDAQGEGSTSRSDSHGGFDNDKDTLNSVLFRILGATPKRPFDTRDLQY